MTRDRTAAGTHVPGLTARLREETYKHVFQTPEAEVGGVFVGRRGAGEPPSIEAIIPAFLAQGSLTSLTFTHQAWEEIHAEMERHHPDREIVGWYHSHPGHGVFLSEHDLFIHRNFFADESSVAFVVDPIRGEEGVFGWRGGAIVQLSAGETGRPALGAAAPTGALRGDPSGRTARSAGDDDYPLAGYLAPGALGLLIGILLALLTGTAGAAPQPVSSHPASWSTAAPAAALDPEAP